MGRIERLVKSYVNFISIPWRDNIAPAQRVVMCVYNQSDERMFRFKIEEFELATRQAGHEWNHYDLTNIFARWLSQQKYRESYFKKPELLAMIYPKFLEFINEDFQANLDKSSVTSNSVVAISGVGSLFGLIKVKDVVDQLAPKVPGKFLIFFPGSYEDSNYRLLDGYDGWNYLAIPITADKVF